MRCCKSVIVIIILILAVNISKAESKFRINIGGGLGQTEMSEGLRLDEMADRYQNIYDNTNVYSLYAEIVFPKNDRLFLGGGIYYFFNGDEIRYMPYSSHDVKYEPLKAILFMPYITGNYHLRFMRMALFTQLRLGYGYTKFTDNYFEERMYIGSSFGIIPSLGILFYLGNSHSVNLEIGYRYIETLKFDNVFSEQDFYDRDVDFSGLFFQTGISFGL